VWVEWYRSPHDIPFPSEREVHMSMTTQPFLNAMHRNTGTKMQLIDQTRGSGMFASSRGIDSDSPASHDTLLSGPPLRPFG